ncbi:MAG: 2-C-methyl-D-erythritol 4-phosphate cytidylyltransferase [Bacteroidaceae bacterium]|nr:2-C-methyl-D-erythritol 4-phosphate cytidylyltransferase [Bacteroidaceae bacterium]
MNPEQSHIIALLLAGGQGSRIGAQCPKQYIEIDGEPVILRTMRAFQQHPDITDIYVVCSPRWQDYVIQQAKRGGISKLRATMYSGPTAFQSIRLGIEGLLHLIPYGQEETIVLVHDAVRPLISYEVISQNIQTCQEKGNAITAIRSNEAYMQTQDGLSSNDYIRREALMRAQTPHTFPLSTLRKIMIEADNRGITDHQSLFTLCNELGIHPLYIAEGDPMNFKITEPGDIKIYQALREVVR